MTTETINLWFNGFTAVGTVGAVIMSLIMARPRKRFKVHKVEAQALHSMNGNRIERTDGSLRVDIENCLEFQMQIFEARIHISDGNAQILSFQNCFIPAMSRYHAKTALHLSTVKKGAFKNAKKIKVTLGTSFGDKTIEVSNPDTLRRILESENEYTAIDTATNPQSV